MIRRGALALLVVAKKENGTTINFQARSMLV